MTRIALGTLVVVVDSTDAGRAARQAIVVGDLGDGYQVITRDDWEQWPFADAEVRRA